MGWDYANLKAERSVAMAGMQRFLGEEGIFALQVIEAKEAVGPIAWSNAKHEEQREILETYGPRRWRCSL